MSETATWTDPARLAPNERIALIERTSLGFEDHGILTCWLHCSYGSSGQGIGGYTLDDKPGEREPGAQRTPSVECGRWVLGVLRCVGVETWEKVAGKTIIVILDGDDWNAMPVGIRPLPTSKRGVPFYFREEEV